MILLLMWLTFAITFKCNAKNLCEEIQRDNVKIASIFWKIGSDTKLIYFLATNQTFYEGEMMSNQRASNPVLVPTLLSEKVQEERVTTFYMLGQPNSYHRLFGGGRFLTTEKCNNFYCEETVKLERFAFSIIGTNDMDGERSFDGLIFQTNPSQLTVRLFTLHDSEVKVEKIIFTVYGDGRDTAHFRAPNSSIIDAHKHHSRLLSYPPPGFVYNSGLYLFDRNSRSVYIMNYRLIEQYMAKNSSLLIDYKTIPFYDFFNCKKEEGLSSIGITVIAIICCVVILTVIFIILILTSKIDYHPKKVKKSKPIVEEPLEPLEDSFRQMNMIQNPDRHSINDVERTLSFGDSRTLNNSLTSIETFE